MAETVSELAHNVRQQCMLDVGTLHPKSCTSSPILTKDMRFGCVYADNPQVQVKIHRPSLVTFSDKQIKILLRYTKQIREYNLDDGGNSRSMRPFSPPFTRSAVDSPSWDKEREILKDTYPNTDFSRLFVYTDINTNALAVSVYAALPANHLDPAYNIEFIYTP